jgi:hypothetical protein
MSAMQKLLAMTGADLPGALKAATDGLESLNQHMARTSENMGAIASRLDAIDQRQGQILSLLQNLFSRDEHKETGT